MENLSLKATAVGSLPYKNPSEALDLIFECFREIPFWPQLAAADRREDMIIQYNQGVPGIKFNDKEEKYYCDTQSDEFFSELEEFFLDYESVVNEKDKSNLSKYAITEPYSCSIAPFLERLKGSKFAKGHVTGPFTWGTSLCDSECKCSFYDETYREVLVKAITLKAVWQIEEFKKHSPGVKPVIFLDEPVLSQYGTSAFVTVQREDIENAISEIAQVIRAFGGLCAVHCCGKADWSLLIDSNVDIINFDGYAYSKSLCLYSNELKSFLKKGGYLAWGMVPTLDKTALENADAESLTKLFEKSVSYLTEKGIEQNLIIKQSFLTPSCGAGGLNIELAQKAMRLTSELSKRLSEIYEVI